MEHALIAIAVCAGLYAGMRLAAYILFGRNKD